MYRALLWKEWRESRFFLFIMATGTFLLSLIFRSLELNDNDILAFLYVIIWTFFTVLLAASQFSNEAESGTSDFLLSRPAHWFKIWLIKTLYGICALLAFGFILLLLGSFFIPSLIKSTTILPEFIRTSPSTPPVFFGTILFSIMFCLYFTGCIVSTSIKSSLKGALATLIVSGFFVFILIRSSFLFNFTSSSYIFWIIFPVLFFIIFIKHQANLYITKISYWTLSIGGSLFWMIFFIKGVSLLIILRQVRYFNLPVSIPKDFLFFLILFSFMISALITSFFACGVNQRNYPGWWKLISSINLLIIFTICTAAILSEVMPSTAHKSLAERPLDRREYYSPPIIISRYDYIKKPLLFKGNIPYWEGKVSYRHIILNENSGEAYPLGTGKFMIHDIYDVSIRSQWAVYSCPALRWGVYYIWGLWSENLKTNKQHLLMTGNSIPSIKGRLFDKGSRLLIIDETNSNKILFSIKNGTPYKINKVHEPGTSELLHIDTNNKLYFYNTLNRIITCYNHDLIKEYELSVVKDKMKEIISGYIQNKQSNHNKDRTYIDLDYFTVGRDGRLKQRSNNDLPNMYFSEPYFSISPDNKYLIFNISIHSKTGEAKKLFYKPQYKSWCVSLPDGIYNKVFEENNINSNSYNWVPGTDSILAVYQKTKQENKVLLIDLKKGISKNLINEESFDMQDKLSIEWSDNGKNLIVYSSSGLPRKKTVSLYRFDPDTLTFSFITSTTGLQNGHFKYNVKRWSLDHSQIVFCELNSGIIWRLDLNEGKWSKLKSPFKNCELIGISNKGEVYVAPLSGAKIYRVTETDSEIIYEG